MEYPVRGNYHRGDGADGRSWQKKCQKTVIRKKKSDFWVQKIDVCARLLFTNRSRYAILFLREKE